MEQKPDKKTLKDRYRDIAPLFKEEKTQNFTTLVLTLIAFVIFGLFAIEPTITTIIQLRKQLSDSQIVLDKLQNKIDNLKLLQQQYSLLDQDLLAVFKAVPKTPTVPLLAGQLNAIALEHNLKLIRLQILEVEIARTKTASASASEDANTTNNNGSFSFLIDVQGQQSDMTNFLSSLVNFDRIVTIDTLSETRDPQKDTQSILSIRGKAYFKE